MNHLIIANSFLNRVLHSSQWKNSRIRSKYLAVWQKWGLGHWLCFRLQQNFSADDLGINLAGTKLLGACILPSPPLAPQPPQGAKTRLLALEAWSSLRATAQPENSIHSGAKGAEGGAKGGAGSFVFVALAGGGGAGWVGGATYSSPPHFLMSGSISF